MTLKHVMRALCLLVVGGMFATKLFAQVDQSRLWMRAYSDASGQESLTFGNRDANTFGVDSLQPGEFMESEPPPPSPGFDCVWILPPGRTGQWGPIRGLLRRDWRASNGAAYEARIDTYAVKFQDGLTTATISFKWPDPVYIAAHCDSMILWDVSGFFGFPGNKVNMATMDTLDVPAAGDNLVSVFRIIKYGKKLVETAVRLENPTVPGEFALQQNYPNPFNPSTKMKFDIRVSAETELAIYNVLGQKVATLENDLLAPGTYSAVWNGTTDNGTPVTSGIYYARMTARPTGDAEPFVALRKLLLMK